MFWVSSTVTETDAPGTFAKKNSKKHFYFLFILIWACTEPAGTVGTMIAGVNPNACDQLPLLGCTASLDGISQLDAIPSNLKNGLTVADICPCSCAGNF